MDVDTKLSSKFFKSLKSQTIITIFLGIIQLAYFSIMSRLLNKEEFGLFAIVTAVNIVLSEISHAGLGSAVIQKKDASEEYVSTAFSLSVIIGGAGMLLLLSLSSFFSYKFVGSDVLTIPFCLISFSIFLTTISSITSGLFMRELRFYELGSIQIFSNLISSSLGIYLAYCHYGVYALIVAMLTNTFIIFIVTLFFQRRKIGFLIKKKHVGQILSYGGWLTGSGVIRSLYNQLDRLITGKWISVSSLGMYTRASGFVITITTHVNTIFDTILFPILSGIQDDKQRICDAYRKSTELILMMSCIASFSLILVAESVIYIFLGEKWMDTSLLFKVVSLSILLHPFCRIGDSFFRSIGIVKQYFLVRVVLCISAVVLIFIGCQVHGIEGLAFAYVLSRLVDASLKMYVLNRYMNIDLLNLLKQPAKNLLTISILFVMCYLLFKNISPLLGNIISVLCFWIMIITLILFNPHIFGTTCYNYIFKNLKRKQ